MFSGYPAKPTDILWAASGATVALASLVNPAGAGVLILFLEAAAWSRNRPGVRYPVKWW